MEVDIDNSPPIGFAHLVEHAIAQDAGRIDDAMESTKLGCRLGHHGLDSLEIGHALGV